MSTLTILKKIILYSAKKLINFPKLSLEMADHTHSVDHITSILNLRMRISMAKIKMTGSNQKNHTFAFFSMIKRIRIS